MSFTPKYTITQHLLANVKRITVLIADLNNRRFPHVVLLELERTAREVSSFASTSIEGNPLPLTEVKKILKSRPTNLRDSEKEILNYNQALQELNKRLEKNDTHLSTSLILNIQKQVVEGLLPKFDIGLRKKPVVVNDPRTGQVVYLPPDTQDVKLMVEELISFINDNKEAFDPLILAGIFHKQMVIIHPFMDGNGRTTRLATKILLAEMGLNIFNLFSFENYYNNNVTKYFQIVGEFGNYYDLIEKVDFTSWLEYFTEGIIDELLRVQKLLPTFPIPPQMRLEEHHRAILEFIQKNGSINQELYAKITSRAKSTRALDFQELTSLKLIVRKGKGKATYYVLRK